MGLCEIAGGLARALARGLAEAPAVARSDELATGPDVRASANVDAELVGNAEGVLDRPIHAAPPMSPTASITEPATSATRLLRARDRLPTPSRPASPSGRASKPVPGVTR